MTHNPCTVLMHWHNRWIHLNGGYPMLAAFSSAPNLCSLKNRNADDIDSASFFSSSFKQGNFIILFIRASVFDIWLTIFMAVKAKFIKRDKNTLIFYEEKKEWKKVRKKWWKMSAQLLMQMKSKFLYCRKIDEIHHFCLSFPGCFLSVCWDWKRSLFDLPSHISIECI